MESNLNSSQQIKTSLTGDTDLAEEKIIDSINNNKVPLIDKKESNDDSFESVEY